MIGTPSGVMAWLAVVLTRTSIQIVGVALDEPRPLCESRDALNASRHSRSDPNSRPQGRDGRMQQQQKVVPNAVAPMRALAPGSCSCHLGFQRAMPFVGWALAPLYSFCEPNKDREAPRDWQLLLRPSNACATKPLHHYASAWRALLCTVALCRTGACRLSGKNDPGVL